MTLAAVTALAASAIFSGLGCWLASKTSSVLDHPGERSLHTQPVPRTGGVVIHSILITVGIVMWVAGLPLASPVVATGWLLVLLVSWIDDLGHVAPPARLLVHLLASGMVAWMVVDISPWLAMFVLLAVAWMINLFNFMDGMDGLAGSMALVASAVLALFGFVAGDMAYGVFSLAVCGVMSGFLLLNLPPARLFMGDTGSAGIGYLLGSLGVLGILRDHFSWQAYILLVMPFCADATLTLMRRILGRERFWEAHRGHIYQQLVLAGLPVRKVLAFEWVIMLLFAALALLAWASPDWASWVLAGGAAGVTAGFIVARQMTSGNRAGAKQ